MAGDASEESVAPELKDTFQGARVRARRAGRLNRVEVPKKTLCKPRLPLGREWG